MEVENYSGQVAVVSAYSLRNLHKWNMGGRSAAADKRYSGRRATQQQHSEPLNDEAREGIERSQVENYIRKLHGGAFAIHNTSISVMSMKVEIE